MYEYIGSELDLFAQAIRWKAYIKNELKQYVSGHVLEVGAGIGETTKALLSGNEDSWTCLEPDSILAEHIIKAINSKSLSKNIVPKVIIGKIDHPECNRKYDTILYIDVLEHIEEDASEITKASQRLKKWGHLVVLAPAHHWLFSAFDREIGHFRRYNHEHFKKITPSGTRLLRVRYLDSVGCLASLSNRFILRSSIPNKTQLKIWDLLMVPISRITDPILGYKIGKSIYVVWQKF